MTVSRPPTLRVGDEIVVGDAAHTITGLSASHAWLADVTGAESSVALAELLSAPGFRMVARAPAVLPPRGLLDSLPLDAVEQARWWERHIVEVITGVPPEAGKGARPRPEYDPAACTLRQRELAKIAELAGDGHQVPLSTFQRLRLAYEKRGVWGLIDHRATRNPGARTDERVLQAIGQAVAEETNRSTGTVARLRRRVEQILASQHGVDPVSVMPARATFYRLAGQISAGRHTFGRPGPAGRWPGGRMGRSARSSRCGRVSGRRSNSTPLDVRVVLDNGIVDRVELSWLIDLATRTIPAAVLRPATKAVDAALLLARSMTPEPMRPGWPDALRMSRSVLPHRRLTQIDQRLEHAAARPVIVPETIVCDHGIVYMSQAFRNACRAMGISLQPSHEGSPWEKGTVETSFSAVGTLFAQYVAGYVGSSVERRGEHAERDAAWSMLELQELLDEWLVAVWQNRPHDGLRHPLMPGKALTPNEMYPEERHYARASTLYRLGDYFGWIEILRRGLQFLDLGEEERTRGLVERLDTVSRTFSNTEWFPASVFRLFRDEQRALGEVMLEPAEGEVRRYQCIGYATFVDRLDRESGFARWFERLGREIDKLSDPAPGQIDRLIELQHALIHVIDFLDPEGLRFPKAHIKLLDPPAVARPGDKNDGHA